MGRPKGSKNKTTAVDRVVTERKTRGTSGGRPQGIGKVAKSVTNKTTVNQGAIIRYRDTQHGRVMDVVPFCRNEKGGIHYSTQYSVDLDTGADDDKDILFASHKIASDGKMYVRYDGSWVEYIGSSAGFDKLVKEW